MSGELWTAKFGLHAVETINSLFSIRYGAKEFRGSTPARAVKRFEKWFDTGFDDADFERQETV